jgi:UDP-glucose 4-epimerase
MRILVTGGAGFIGSHIVEGLLANGHEVAVLDDLSTGRRENVPAAAKLFECDLRDLDRTRQVLREFRPEAVSHQAALANVAASVREPRRDAEVNLIGGLNLLEACKEPGARVARFVFASTGGAVYGEVPPGTRADESTPARPASPYAIHKLAFEQHLSCLDPACGIRTTVLRYANVYGPRQDPHGEAGVVAIFFAAALAGGRLRVNAERAEGDAGCIRDYVYVADVARLNLLALAGTIEQPVVNVGAGEETTTLELARTVLSLVGREPAIDGGAPRLGDLRRSVLDPSIAVRYLGPPTPLAEGLDHTRAYYTSRRS